MTCGIYRLNFSNTNKVYIGQSTDIERRIVVHLYAMKYGHSSIKLNNAYLTYGFLDYTIICECPEEELDNTEEEAIDIFNSIENGFNTVHGRTSRRTHLCGENAAMSSCSNSKIIETFELLVGSTKTILDISEIVGISNNVVKDISAGVSHAWLLDIFGEVYSEYISKGRIRTGEQVATSLYTNDNIKDMLIYTFHNPLETYTSIANRFSIDVGTLKSIVTGRNHKWLLDVIPLEYAEVLSRKGSRGGIGRDAKSKGIVYPPIISPEGTTYNITNIRSFAEEHGLNQGHLGAVMRGKEFQHKGWKLLDDIRVQSVP